MRLSIFSVVAFLLVLFQACGQTDGDGSGGNPSIDADGDDGYDGYGSPASFVGVWTVAYMEITTDYEYPGMEDYAGVGADFDPFVIADWPEGGLVTFFNSGFTPLTVDGNQAASPENYEHDGGADNTTYILDHFVLTTLTENTVLLDTEYTVDPDGDGNNFSESIEAVLVR